MRIISVGTRNLDFKKVWQSPAKTPSTPRSDSERALICGFYTGPLPRSKFEIDKECGLFGEVGANRGYWRCSNVTTFHSSACAPSLEIEQREFSFVSAYISESLVGMGADEPFRFLRSRLYWTCIWFWGARCKGKQGWWSGDVLRNNPNKTYWTIPDSYSWVNSMTCPSSSRAFLISKTATMEAIATQIAENAKYLPGHVLYVT